MNAISVTKLYELLSAKLGKETAENLTTFIEDKINQELESRTKHLASKEDIARLDLKISETNNRISESKSEIIKWMFLFWVGQVVVTFGFLLIYLKK